MLYVFTHLPDCSPELIMPYKHSAAQTLLTAMGVETETASPGAREKQLEAQVKSADMVRCQPA